VDPKKYFSDSDPKIFFLRFGFYTSGKGNKNFLKYRQFVFHEDVLIRLKFLFYPICTSFYENYNICLHFFYPLLWLDPNPNPNFFSDSDSDPSKSFGFFRIRIRNTRSGSDPNNRCAYGLGTSI
jgi:hypothetical protein